MRASVSPLPCCYKAVVDPLPGSWLSLNLNNSSSDDQPFCQEPDQQQLDKAGMGWPPSPSSSSLSLPDPAAAFFAMQQSCDTIPSPAAKLNVTASEIGTAWYIWRQRLREHDLLNQSLSREGIEEEDDDVGFDFVRSFGKLFEWLTQFSRETPSFFNGTLTDAEEPTATTTPPLPTTTTSTSSASTCRTASLTLALCVWLVSLRHRTALVWPTSVILVHVCNVGVSMSKNILSIAKIRSLTKNKVITKHYSFLYRAWVYFVCVFECVFISETSSNRSTSRLKEWSWWRSPRCKKQNKNFSVLLKKRTKSKIAKQKSLTGYCDTNVCTRQDQLIRNNKKQRRSISISIIALEKCPSIFNLQNFYCNSNT